MSFVPQSFIEQLPTVERRTAEPDTMQPPETKEFTASPRRPNSSWTNLAGGTISP